MKKIININLSGRVIPIEDSAYEMLQGYIESLRRYFANEEGRDEIINDIESRIAELMNEKVRKGSTAITDVDINEIIASMGRPEDFDAEAADTADTIKQSAASSDFTYAEKKTRRRLYRDSSDKIIGGVCSGIANYLNTDPAIVRILFAIVTFGGFGIGFLVYILLWMFLPTRDLENFSGKRLYRNPDDRIIGGVAGGLAAYFNTRTSTIRFIFAAPIIFSSFLGVIKGLSWHNNFDFFPNIIFGSLSGTFILAYIILWMVLPEARSNYEKMEMRGEKVDVNTIRQNVKEGMDNVKERVKGWSGEVKASAQNISNKAKEFANTRGKDFANDISERARRGGHGLGHAIGVLFKVFFLFIAGTIAFALFVAMIALIFGGVAWWPINNYLWTSKWQQLYAWGTVIFFIVIPLIGFITWVIRRVIRVRSRSGYLGWTFGFLWAIGWVTAILFAASIARDFREYKHVDSVVTINQPSNNKMIVAVSQPELEYTGSFGWINDDSRHNGWDLSEDTLKMSTVRFNIIASKDSSYYVTLKKYSYGKTQEDALRRAEKIQYSAISKDSVLDLASGYTINKENKFRFQQVEIEIQVPVEKKIRFDASIREKLNPADFKIRRNYRHRGGPDIQFSDDYNFYFRSDVDYTMGVDGILKDPSGNKANENNDYRYKPESNDTALPGQHKERKQTPEESGKKQKEIKNSTGKIESMDEDETTVSAGSPSPVFSLLGMFN